MKPLAGLRVVVTRAARQAEELACPLRERGAEVILLPVIGIAPPGDREPLRTAARSSAYDWIVFTSANAVDAFAAELRDADRRCTARIATVGSATRETAEANDFRVEIMPQHYIAESLVEAFASHRLEGCRILIPSAAATRDVIAPALRQRGALVDIVEAYRNIPPPEAASKARTVLQPPYPDWVTFASSSAVTNLVKLIGIDILGKSKLATIGPATSETARSLGLNVTAQARVHTMEGLVEAIAISL